MQSNVQHLAWADRLFARFSAAWGVQKLGAMFPAESHDEVRHLWASQLSRYEPESIRVALDNAISAGKEWPPSLSEFVEYCRLASIARQQHKPAALLDMPRTSKADAAERLVEAYAAFAKQPKKGREWAHKVMARVQANESVPLAVRELAERALAA